MVNSGHKQPVVVIAGPTGIGKTALAVAIAPALHAEIISADSRQIYRYMDIGTAKPTPAERATVPHHLIDVVDPDQVLTMSEYQERAYASLASLHQQGRLPLLVGGTGQYLTAVLEGWNAPQVPPNPALRAELETFAAEHGALALFDRLRKLDPVGAAQMDPYNARRTVRALEVCLITGQPFSGQRRKNPPPYQVLQFGLTQERTTLYPRLDQRIDAMIEAGLVEEVRQLYDELGYGWELPSMSGLGYKQIGAYWRGEVSLAEAVQAIKSATHTFVRRQYTWFRKYLQLTWLTNPDPAPVIDAIQLWQQGLITHG